MWKLFIVFILIPGVLAACQTGKEETVPEPKESIYEPMEYQADEGTERRGKIPTGKDSYFKRTADEEFRQSKYQETNRSHDNDFNNEDAMRVVEKVNELDEVTMAQAFSTDDRMYVAVMINPYDRRNQSIPDKIEEKVAEVSDKKVTIYTNNNNWDHMKDLNSRLKASDMPDKWKNRFQSFFNQN
ncbi:YhcN/YlaJ family sporulation lipoprotein [Halobacillus sp. ACCC02827]|uniref:YhcN/YlaJ family sporulation lipoprotein n=1 Tax=Bacillaceae TaxID=186817 RepID=UPI0002A4E18C|nr:MULTISPECIES: YhcN/YlaJ family sporulation lipoprotein [Bacillaceae]ELK45722.1 hypothetical protein D479_13772 [Halobacillus sp. BAB-2008]QHT47280.1 hypothetical protein M662_12540 [Bacillus sp. SB49]WJE14513.1 YhcN/YlaJ family sporulation lipoprotein [Halobacillus sp. ACCC02827]